MKSQVNPKRVAKIVQRLLIVGYALAALVLFFYLLHPSQISTAAPDAPDAPGLIAGQVVNQQGTPVPDTIVGLYRYPFIPLDFSEPYPSPLRTVRTDSSGHYTFSLVNSGVYRLLFRDWQRLYARQYYSGSSYLNTASDLSVFGKTITNVNAVLTPGAVITGSISISDSNGGISLFNEVRVELFEKIGGEWRRTEGTSLFIYAENVYALQGLAPGIFRLCARLRFVQSTVYGCYGASDNGNGTIGGYNEPRPNVDKAANITITAGSTISNIDVVMKVHPNYEPEPIGMGIGGQVTAEDGKPLEGIYIAVIDPISNIYHGFVQSSASGKYFASVPAPGDYAVLFQGGYWYGNQYWTEYYNDVFTSEAATLIHLEQDQQVSGINAQLARSSYITGVVTIPGDQFSDMYYALRTILYQKRDTGWVRHSEGYVDYYTHSYTFQGLEAGVYRVEAGGHLSRPPYSPILDDYLNGFYGGGSTLEQATDIILANRSDHRSNINIQLGVDQFEGRVSGAVTVNGAPKSGIKVELFRNAKNPILYLTTDNTGQYTVEGLLNGRYQVKFSDPTGVYASVFYNNSPSLQAAQTLTITGKTAYSDINAALIPGGTIQGVLIHSDGKPVAKATVDLLWQGAARAASAIVATVKTNDRGEFTLVGAYPGVYQMRFTSPRFRPNSIMYGTFNPTTGAYDPMNLTVGGGQVMNTPMQVAAPTMVEPAPEPAPRLFLPILIRE